MQKCVALFIICLVSVITDAIPLPSYMKRCSQKDPKINECALKSGRDAIPSLIKGDQKYGIPVLDPLHVKELSVNQTGIAYTFRDMVITGVKNSDLKEVSFDFDKRTMRFSITVPRLEFLGTYEVTGKLLTFPISGNGDFNNTQTDIAVTYILNYDLTKMKDGTRYVVPQSYVIDTKPGYVIQELTNLFNGNKLLGNTLNAFTNENWRDVYNEVGKPIYKALGLVVYNIFLEVTKKVPYEEFFSDAN
ncbi:protein takeout-like [Periplaneta americana]|uniref:protein takeout-like n=1 Tax=Periplaneta americana TaxID=6978 RepID=UPI0037E852FD